MTNTDLTPDKLIRSRRRSISIEIRADGEVVVRAPLHLPDSEISGFVNQKKDWIARKQHELKSRAEAVKPKTYSYGEEFSYLGREYKLLPLENSEEIIIFDNAFYINVKYADNLKNSLLRWYLTKADKFLRDRTKELAAKVNFKHAHISVGSAAKDGDRVPRKVISASAGG